MICEVIAEGVFQHKKKESSKWGNAWQNAITALNALEVFMVSDRAADRVPYFHSVHLPFLLKRGVMVRHGQITKEQRKLIAYEDKQKAHHIRNTAMKNLKETRQTTEKKGPKEKRFKQSSADTFIYLQQKLECDKELR